MISGTVQDGGSVVVSSDLNSLESAMVCSVGGLANEVVTSEFTISGNETAFIAGYGDLTWSDFKTGYCGFYYQDSSVIDAEKCTAITQDNMMCWAGTAANMLYYTGWWLAGTDTEDKVFSVFIDNFTLGKTYGGNAYHAIDWYFTGHYSPKNWSEWDIPLENSGGFYSETFKTENLSSYLTSTTFTVSGLTTAKQKLEAGYGVGVTFGYYNSEGTRTGGHLITLWGVTCDSSYSVTDSRYYTGIIVTDSDDNKSVSDPLSAPDTLKIISISYDSSLGAYLIDPDYAGANSRLEHLTFLAPNTNAFPDGSGLVLVYSSGTLVKKGPVMTRETLVAGINDSMSVNSGGAASGTCVSSGGFMAVSSGGTAAETAVYQGGSVVVFSGGTAGDTIVSSGGSVVVFSGGMVGDTIVSSGGSMVISSGGTAGDTIVSRGGSMVISSGGTAGDTCVFSGGSMVVSSGGGVLGAEIYSRGGANIWGSANNVTVYSGGSLRINAGTVVSGVNASEGAFFGIAVGSKSYIQGSYAGSSFEIRGGVVSNYSVNSGYLSILGGAGAGGVTVKEHGLLRAGLRGTASNTVVSSGGSITLEGGKHTHTLTMADGAFVSAGNGGIIDFTVSARSVSDGYLINDLSLIQGTPVYTITVSADQAQGVYKLAQGADGFKGTLTIGNGTIDYGTITVNGADLVYGNVAYSLDLYKGDLTLNIGNVAPAGDQVKVFSSGALIKQGKVLTGEMIFSGANDSMHVSSGGVAESAKVSNGSIAVSSGGVANNTQVDGLGIMTVFSGGVINGAVLNSGALYAQGGTASEVTLKNGARVYLYSGAVLIDAANNGGTIVVNSGAVASNLSAEMEATASGGYTTHVRSGGVANTVKLGYRGYLNVSGGGFASDVSVSSRGRLCVIGEEYTPEGEMAEALYGSARGVTVSSGGSALINGGEVTGLMVSSGGHASVAGVADVSAVDVYGKLYGGEIKYGGTLTIGSGGVELWEDTVLGGTVTVNGFANIYGELVFDLSERSGEDTFIVDNIANLNLTEIGSYTISISENQANGAYKLAGNAASFSNTVTVEGTALSVNGVGAIIGDKQYTLAVTDSILTLTIGTAPAGDQVQVYSGSTLVNRGTILTGETIVGGANNTMYVYSGGTANITTVNSEGRLRISSGGVANSTTVNASGWMNISSGGVANSTTLSGNAATWGQAGHLYIYSGGVANETTVDFGGWINLYGGAVNGAVLNAGGVLIAQGGTASQVTINNATVFLHSGAVLIDAANNGGTIAVSSGGVASNLTAELVQIASSDYARIAVWSGGVANTVKLGYTGWLHVAGGGFASDVSVSSRGRLFVIGEEYTPEGGEMAEALYGSARGVTVSSGGSALINGGEVTGLMVSSGGHASVAGVADVSAVDVYGKLYGGEIKYGGTLTIGSGGVELREDTVFGGTVTVNGFANIYGELVFDLSERSGGDTLIVDNIANLNLTEIGSYTISISENQANGAYKLAGNASSFSDTITVEGTALSVNGSGAIIGDRQYTLAVTDSILTLTIGTAPAGDQVQVYSGSTLVNRGTILTGETIVGGANNTMYVYSGGTASDTHVSSGANMYVSSGGVAKDTLVEGLGAMVVSSGGVVNSTILSGNRQSLAQAGRLTILSGGVANETTVDFGGWINLYGGAVNGAVLNAGGVLIARGGTVSKVTLRECYGVVHLYSGAVLIDAANNGGVIAVSSGGVASNVFAEMEATASSGYARTHVSSGGVANTVELGYRGWLLVYGGGFVSDVSVSSRGFLYVKGEEYTPEGGEMAEALYGSARGVTVSSGGSALISGGEVTGLMVSSGGIASVAGVVDVSAVDVYGKLYSAEVKYGGTLTIGSGGVELREDTVFGGTVTVNGFANIYGELVFDLSERSGEDTYIVDNIANLNLTEIGSYTISISENQANGAYKLAGNAASFNDTITVEGTALSVNGSGAIIGDRQYTLAVTDSILTLTIGTADQVPPVLNISGNAVEWTNKDVVLTVECDDKEASVSYRVNGGSWQNCSGSVTVSANCTIEFKAVDAAGNTAVETVGVDRIDKMAPTAPVVTADVTGLTNSNVTLTADFGDAVTKEYSFNSRSWYTYTGSVVLSSNSSVYFRGTDHVGNVSEISSYKVDNIDKKAPGIPGNITFAIDKDSVLVDWADAADNGPAGTKGYYFRYGNSANLTGTGTFSGVSNIQLEDLAVGTWYFQIAAVDSVGNISQWSTVQNFEILPAGPENPVGDADGLKWDAVPGAKGYVVEYSTDDFATVISVETPGNSLDSFALPETTFKWRVRALEDEVWSYGNEITGKDVSGADELVSDRDGVKDLFFANAEGVWEDGFAAQHLGFGSWQGTREKVLLAGKNKLTDIFEGSSDANVLVLTDDSNGDALFVDDIYSALGTNARLEQISEIRAGAGDDIVDMTSQRYEYSGSSIRICGGDGNDTIWGAAESNVLFGDQGNDRLVGGSGSDVIAGGAGNDSMHGCGGDDIFTFGGNWGNDVVEQYAAGSVTLYLGSGISGSWDADTRTWSDGTNSIRVVGTENISIKFYETSEISESGAFEEQVSRKIFEDSGSGFIA